MLLKFRNRPARRLQARREHYACATRGMPLRCSAAGSAAPPEDARLLAGPSTRGLSYALIAGRRTSHGRSRRQGARSQYLRVRTAPSGLRESPAITSRPSQPRLSCDVTGKPGRSGESTFYSGKERGLWSCVLYSRSRSAREDRALRAVGVSSGASLPHTLLLEFLSLYTLIGPRFHCHLELTLVPSSR
jgi:hypothetical protein